MYTYYLTDIQYIIGYLLLKNVYTDINQILTVHDHPTSSQNSRDWWEI